MPRELKAVLISMLCFFFLFGTYSIVKPVRDAMGTIYGITHVQELFTGTFVASVLFAPLYSWLASRIRLSTFLPWVYGFIAVSLMMFYALSLNAVQSHERWVAPAFFGTGRLIERFGVTTGLPINPVIIVIAFLAVVFSPVVLVLGGIQVVRRVAEYAIAKPTREMLFTVVDQESRYKAKNVIDTIVYRFGDPSSAWVSSVVLRFGIAGLVIFGAVVAALWFPVA